MIGTYDMTVAKQIWRNKIAADRRTAFEQNDIALRDAQISGDQDALQTAIARRDGLRELGEMIDAATSIEELREILP